MFSEFIKKITEVKPIDSQTDYNLKGVTSWLASLYRMFLKRVRLPTISCNVMQGTQHVCSKRYGLAKKRVETPT